jgi:ABC-type multidrug transport system fused ATPase/permease subunit
VRALSGTQGLTGTFNKLYELSPLLDLVQQRLLRYRKGTERWGSEPLVLIEEIRLEDVSYSYVEENRAIVPVDVLPPAPASRRERRALRAVDDAGDRPDATEVVPAPDVKALDGVSFTVRRGEAVGIVGPSGSGKSTLVQILLGLRSPTAGRYIVNGRPAREYAEDDWYSDLALVPQHPHLIEGTVSENIAFFRPGITQEDIERGARLANVHDEIMSWVDGYDTMVASQGSSLSGGQRQRVSLARAFAGRPSLLVLDEPTSALDMQSEALIRDALEHAKADMTLFVVAHRLSTLNVCDRIMVLKEGHLEHFAPAQDLLRSNEFYREAVELSRLA